MQVYQVLLLAAAFFLLGVYLCAARPFLRRRTNHVEVVVAFTMSACLGVATLYFRSDKALARMNGLERGDIQSYILAVLAEAHLEL